MAVPLLSDLDRMGTSQVFEKTQDGEEQMLRLQAAWRSYISAVPPHAHRQIQNFTLACIAEGKNFDDEDEDRLLLPKNVRKTSEGIIEADVKIQKIPDQKNENADSGVSGSEYSGSEKSVPIYSLSNGLSNHYRGLLDFNRRGMFDF